MGLEAFKTEGPRTRKKKDDSTPADQQVIHSLKGTDPDTGMVPESVRVHEVICRETTKGFDPDNTKDVFVCEKCKRTANDYHTILKVDKLEFKDDDWYREFIEAALEAEETTDREDTLGEFTLKNMNKTSQSTSQSSSSDSDDSDDTPDSGLMSFKS